MYNYTHVIVESLIEELKCGRLFSIRKLFVFSPYVALMWILYS